MKLTKTQKPGIERLFFMGLLWLLSFHGFSTPPLIVGIGVSGPPLIQKIDTDSGAYYFGFCIDLMNNICKNIGKTCHYKEITLDNQFELLNNGQIDLLMLASPYTPFGLEQYALSIPYSVSKIQFITLKSNPINGIEDIKNKKIGVIKETFYNLLSQGIYHKNNQIIPYNSNTEIISDLAQHKIDAAVFNHALAFVLANNNIYNIKLVGNSIPLGEGYGIIGRPDEEPLIEEISKAILYIENNGYYAAIYRKYYQPDESKHPQK